MVKQAWGGGRQDLYSTYLWVLVLGARGWVAGTDYRSPSPDNTESQTQTPSPLSPYTARAGLLATARASGNTCNSRWKLNTACLDCSTEFARIYTFDDKLLVCDNKSKTTWVVLCKPTSQPQYVP